MDRAIPVPGNEEIDLYTRTYFSLLRSSGEIEIRSLEETHSAMNASLHQEAGGPTLDLSAFLYAAMRLPLCIYRVRLVLLGQSGQVFARGGYPKVHEWEEFRARARRRKIFFDGQETMATFINSISDIDDLIPLLTTYQIEWNKIHEKLLRARLRRKINPSQADFQRALELSGEDLEKLEQVWGADILPCLEAVTDAPMRFAVRLLAGSFTDYRRATEEWWQDFIAKAPALDIHNRPVYFVSSNMHAFPNLLTGYTRLIEDELVQYLRETNPEDLHAEYQRLTEGGGVGSLDNLYYYVLRKYLRTQADQVHYERRLQHEIKLGIYNVRRPVNLDVGLQVYELAKLDPDHLDPRIELPHFNWEKLRRSDALILNIDYPLGMAAYQILAQLSANVGELKGVYIMGKAATLNGRVGDVMIPNILYDEHSQNTFLYRNAFTAEDVAPFLCHGTVLDNQKAVTVRGTFLQNRDFMHLFYKEGYTDIEMEAGPYLCAMYENTYPKRYPINEIIHQLMNAPFDIGLLHYASDTPYSIRENLLSKSLLYFGVDATYATAIAIMRRIRTRKFTQEFGSL